MTGLDTFKVKTSLRGFTFAFIIFFAILFLLVLAVMPGFVATTGAGLNGFDNKGDPAYLAVALTPFFVFAWLLFTAWGRGG